MPNQLSANQLILGTGTLTHTNGAAYVNGNAIMSADKSNVANGYVGLDGNSEAHITYIPMSGNSTTLAAVVPKAGETVYINDYKDTRVGDGATAVANLPFKGSRVIYVRSGQAIVNATVNPTATTFTNKIGIGTPFPTGSVIEINFTTWASGCDFATLILPLGTVSVPTNGIGYNTFKFLPVPSSQDVAFHHIGSVGSTLTDSTYVSDPEDALSTVLHNTNITFSIGLQATGNLHCTGRYYLTIQQHNNYLS